MDIATGSGPLHVGVKLDAEKYKSQNFCSQLLEILRCLQVPGWMNPDITSAVLKVQKVPGSLTNSIFFISCPPVPSTITLLLRIYGLPSEFFISRPQELRAVTTLSSQFSIGPRIYGTFENGRVEEYFESVTLTASDLRHPQIGSWIALRMAELHSVDIGTVDETWLPSEADGFESGLGLKETIKSWLHIARKLLELPAVDRGRERNLELDVFERRWQRYMEWMSDFEGREGRSRRVLSHNDVRRRNILRLTKPDERTLDYRQIILIDFEFASPNPAAFDIANYFLDWAGDWDLPTTEEVLNESSYPTPEERRHFYLAYLTYPPSPSPTAPGLEGSEEMIEALERQVKAWSPASRAFSTVWAIVQGREQLEGKETDFDYIGHSRRRMDEFFKELEVLGV